MTRRLVSGRLQTRRSSLGNHAHLKCDTKIQDISNALIEAGFHSLDKQARALGVCRSTAWTIVRFKHKVDRLSAKTTRQMLANPTLPPTVRLIIEQYVLERSGKVSRGLPEEHNASPGRAEN